MQANTKWTQQNPLAAGMTGKILACMLWYNLQSDWPA
jgi:hypothetical protein